MAQVARSKGSRHQVNNIVGWAYNNGLWQSLIINIAILLALALTFTRIVYKPIPISITFSSETIQEIDMSSPEPLNIESFVGDQQDNAEPIDTPADSELISVNPSFDEPVNLSETKEFAASDLLKDLNGKATDSMVDPWAETSSSKGTGKSSRKGTGGKGNGAGSGASKMEKRLAKYGAKTGDVQVSILWDDYNDIDLWVYVENAQYNYKNYISWTNRSDNFNGMLDVDCNVMPVTRQPVENVFWPKGSSPPGNYTVYVQRYKQWETKKYSTKVEVRILFDGKIITKYIVLKDDSFIKVHTFTKKVTKPQLANKADSGVILEPMPTYDDIDRHLLIGQD